MARDFKLLSVLWIVGACLATSAPTTVLPTSAPTTAAPVSTTATTVPTTTAPVSTTVTVPTTTAQVSTTVTVPTTTAPVSTTATTVPTTAAPVSTTVTVPTTAAQVSTTVTVPTTAAPVSTTATVPTTAAPVSTTVTVPTTAAPVSTTATTVPTTTAPVSTTVTVPTTTAPVSTTATVPTTTAQVSTTATTVPTTTAPVSTTATTVPTTAAPVSTTATTVPTTAAPVSTTATTAPTTTAPVSTTTTVPTTTAPVSTTTTVPTTPAPVSTTTTAPSTTAPVSTTTTAPSTTAPVSTTATTVPTTTAPVSTTPTTAATTPTTVSTAKTTAATITSSAGTSHLPTITSPEVPATTELPDPCEIGPCGDGSTCERRANQTYVCLCLAGALYNDISKSCETAKVFPGQLELPGEEYSTKMEDKTSTEFLETSQIIVAELFSIFETTDGYSGSTVQELLRRKSSEGRTRSKDGVTAVVEILFKTNTDINTGNVTNTLETAIADACDTCLLAGANFTQKDLCTKNPCDKNTTDCTPEDGSFKCACKKAYIKTDFSSRICIACPGGKKTEDSISCVECPWYGTSGLNCDESWQLALVVVGSVFGGLLFITLIVLGVTLKSSKKKPKKNKTADSEKPYESNFSSKSPLVNSQAASLNGSANAFANGGMLRIPRATTTNSWDSRSNLEMTPSNSRQNLVPVGRNSRLHNVDDHDDLRSYAQTRPQSSLFSQARPQNNPYDASRPRVNPYASSQGHTNPYYN